MALILGDLRNTGSCLKSNLDASSPFSVESDARSNHFLTKKLSIKFGDTELEPIVASMGGNLFEVQLQDGNNFKVLANLKQIGPNVTELECDIDGAISKRRVVYRTDGSGIIRLFGENGSLKFQRWLPKFLTQKSGSTGSGDSAVAPMPGVVEKINVQAGDPLVVMIAMKMEYVIKAPKTGKVDKVLHNV